MSPTETKPRAVATRLDIIQEDQDISYGDQNLGGLGFTEILDAEGRGWPTVPLPTGLERASDTVVLFVSVLIHCDEKRLKE